MKNEHTGSRKGLSASAGLHSTAAGIWHLPFSAVCCLRSSIHVSGRHSMHDPNSTHSRAANEGRCRRRHCIHGTSHYRVPTGVCQDKPANWPDLDTAEGVHGLWRDVAAHGGADDVVLHLLGLWAAQPERVLPAARAGAFPHLGPRGHGRLVDRLAARVHEVPGAGPLRTGSVTAAADADRVQPEGRLDGHVPRAGPRVDPELCRQRDQHDRHELCTAQGHRTGPPRMTPLLPSSSAPPLSFCVSFHGELLGAVLHFFLWKCAPF
ncbi:uncharacterized protein LOC144172918 isoform X2 [Haemaphysalis longicornis]